MILELEYKWTLPDTCTFSALCADEMLTKVVCARHEIDMLGRYYDTKDALFQRNRGTLRFRKENGKGIACIKLTREKSGASALREEYEVEAKHLIDGLHKLPDVGAPYELCIQVLDEDMIYLLCETNYHRTALEISIPSDSKPTMAELALDAGVFCRENRRQSFQEIELEFKSGNEAVFHSFCEQFEQHFHLIPQTRSKLARAMAV